jgi:hypothetical protein
MMTKKKHFQGKLEATWRKLWDVEFLLEQYKMMREGFRVEYDKIKELLDGVVTYEFLIRKLGLDSARELMKNADLAYKNREEMKDDKDKDLTKEELDILTSIQNEIKGKNDDMDRLRKQMKDVDLMIEGDPEQPLSMNKSVNQNISNLRSVIDMIKIKI